MKRINVSFQEKQQFNQWWFRAILLISLTAIIVGILVSWDNPEVSENIVTSFIIWGSFTFGLVALLVVWFWKLTTYIDHYGIRINCPFVNKKVNWDEIEKLEIVNYGFVGGWGIRFSSKYGSIYNTSGQTGLAVQLKKHKRKFVIGTQKGEELKRIVDKWKSNS